MGGFQHVILDDFVHANCSVSVHNEGPQRVEHLQVLNVSSSEVWLSWSLNIKTTRHAPVSRIRVTLTPEDGGQAHTVLLNANTSEHAFR